MNIQNNIPFQFYNAIFSSLQRAYPLFSRQGLESHLFLLDSEYLLKLYRYEIINNLHLSMQNELVIEQKILLDFYAPNLNARIVKLFPDQPFDLGRNDHCQLVDGLYGIVLKQGTPLLEGIWNTSTNYQKKVFSGCIANSLHNLHKIAPTQKIHNQDEMLLEWINRTLNLIQSKNDKIFIDISNTRQFIKNFKTQLLTGGIVVSNNCVKIHGDPSLSNIVVDLETKQLQFIDPGPALLLGVGYKNLVDWQPDVYWDLAILHKHIYEQSGAALANYFLMCYWKEEGLPNSDFLKKIKAWQILCYLLITCVTLVKWDYFSDPTNPFQEYLKHNNMSLVSYATSYYQKAENLLSIW